MALESHHCHLMQQAALSSMSSANETQAAIINERMEEVNNN